MELAKHDGEMLSVHPLTNEILDKPFKLDAAAVFRDACAQLSAAKDAEAAQELVVQRADAMLSINFGAAKREGLLVDTTTSIQKKRAEEKSGLKQMKRRPFTPKMPNVEPTEE